MKATESVGLYAYIAPELKQARLIAWNALKESVRQFQNITVGTAVKDFVDIHETEPYVQFWNGSKIMLFGADKPDRLRGAKLAGAVIDEVAQMPRELWYEIVNPALMDSNGWALFIGTPKGINLFSELYEKGLDEKYKFWASAKFTCYETDALSPEVIEQYKLDTPEETFKREMLCDFTASAENQLISLFDAQAASKKTINPDFLGRAPLVMGVDVARYGADRSVIIFRKGLLAEQPITVQDTDLTTLAEIVRRFYVQRKPQAVFVDGTGVGGGVVDILNNSLGVPAFDINFGAKSSERQYYNKRTEMWCRMASWLRKGGIIPDDPMLVEELATPTFDVNEQNQKVLESKQKIRDRTGRSPDLADALCLTFAENVELEEGKEEGQLRHEPQVVEDYNPFEVFRRQRTGGAFGRYSRYNRF